MSKATNKTRAFIYDVYAKCETNQDFAFIDLIQHHRIGKFLYEALKRSGRVYMTKPYKWVGSAPNEELIGEIDQLRIDIQQNHIDKYYFKQPKLVTIETQPVTNVTNININDLIEQNEKLIQYIKNLQS